MEHAPGRIEAALLTPAWLAPGEGPNCGGAIAAVRRIGEVALSIALLVLTLPVMIIAACAIRLGSPGPVFYRQTRTGLHGIPFTLFKFRSMRIDAEATGPRWATVDDPRTTRVGAVLRRMRIDELPQLLNVLRGDMCLVGPRPERPHFVEQLTRVIPNYHVRSRLKPGVTGWAQVRFRYGASVDDARQKLAFDLHYMAHRSLKLDALILWLTIGVVLRREGSH